MYVSRVCHDVTWASLPVRQTRQSRVAMMGMSGRMKREVLT